MVGLLSLYLLGVTGRRESHFNTFIYGEPSCVCFSRGRVGVGVVCELFVPETSLVQSTLVTLVYFFSAHPTPTCFCQNRECLSHSRADANLWLVGPGDLLPPVRPQEP